MKVKDIVKQTKEHNRLQGLIDEVKQALETMAKVETVDDGASVVGFTLHANSYLAFEWDEPKKPKTKTLPVYLGSEVSRLIRRDMEKALEALLADLEAKQEALTV